MGTGTSRTLGESISLHILFVLIRVIKSGQTDSFSLLVVTTIGVTQVKRNVETKKIWHYHWFACLVLMSPSYTRDKEMWLKIAINQLWGRCLLLAIYSVQTSCRWKAKLIHNIHSSLFLFSFFISHHKCKLHVASPRSLPWLMSLTNFSPLPERLLTFKWEGWSSKEWNLPSDPTHPIIMKSTTFLPNVP